MNRATRMAEARYGSLPLAESSIAGPKRIIIVIRASLQNAGGHDVGRAPNILAPAQRATAISHSISIHRLGRIDRPIQSASAIAAPTSVEPLSIFPAERALRLLACCARATVFMIVAT